MRKIQVEAHIWKDYNTTQCCLHPRFGQEFFPIRKMDNAGVKTIFQKETCKMVRVAMVLLKGVPLELCIRCKESLLVMGVIVPLLLILELKKKEIL
jgi:hypothetical protein